MILLTNCNIKGLVTPYKNLGDFASDLEQLFKKHHIESISPYLSNASISFTEHHELEIKGFYINGNELIIGESMQSSISQCREICNKR